MRCVAKCRANGLLVFTNFNRVHVVPPCIITAEQVKEGLAILDEVFTVVDRHYEG